MAQSKSQQELPEITQLKRLTTTELRKLYRQLLKADPPPRVRSEFVLRNVAWALQSRTQQKDPVSLRKRLANAAKRATAGKSNAPYKPGTRLVREWQGQVYEVTILEKGYLWKGREYRSLTRIAEEITGTRWSGPRFFGLVKRSSKDNAKT